MSCVTCGQSRTISPSSPFGPLVAGPGQIIVTIDNQPTGVMSINLTNRSIVVRNQGDQFVILEGDKQKLIDAGLVNVPITPMMPMPEETKDETPIIVPRRNRRSMID